jgi:S-adenosylmethionine synthetase
MGKLYRAKGSKDKRRIVMIEKVNPCHPDKVADRIAGAIVDIAYKYDENPKIAVEVLIGHGDCNIIIESSVNFDYSEIQPIVYRIAGAGIDTKLNCVSQDKHLAENQSKEIRCGDNGIFKGVPLTDNEKTISWIANTIYNKYNCDGKYILTDDKLIICQSNAKSDEIYDAFKTMYPELQVIVNPLGEWTGGTDVDTGATNRKLGSDMAQSVTGGGLHGKDLSKADVSVNIYAFLKAQETGKVVELCCAIGDDTIDGKPYNEIVEIARKYIKDIGGFEKFAEWGLF